MSENNKPRIYTLNGLPPEIVAVAFAKSSRSSEPFDEIAEELTEEKSSKFHERWVVGYGHSSVAEHAVLSIAIENVSMLATKVLEDNRLASYTEKSTRYQVFDKTRYLKPAKLMDSAVGELYESTSDFIMDTYTELFPVMVEFFKKKVPREKDVPDKLYEIRINNKALDVIRYLLPVSVLTNLGMTVNARNLENAIVKLLTHPLDEMRQIGEMIKDASLKVTPTLIKYTDYNKYIGETTDAMEKLSSEVLGSGDSENKEGVVLVEYDKDADNKLVTALLYRFSKLSYEQVKEKVKVMSSEEKEKVVDEALSRLDKFDRPLRELEHVYYTMDILMDYGAFRDVQRHRMCTQTNQEFNPDHGYTIPDEISEAGLKEKYVSCMDKAKDAYNKIKEQFPKEAAYIIPMAYNKRVLFTWNLRSLVHFIKLRSGKTGHISYRKIAQQAYEEIKMVHPLLAKYIQVDMS